MIKIQHTRFLAHYALVVFSFCLVRCSILPSSPSETPLPVTLTPSPTVISSPSPGLPTSIPIPSPVPATYTPCPTRTPTPTRTPPPPTLTSDERHAYVEEMLATNGGCELPCWWGVTPGQSDWQSVIDYFVAHGGFQFIILSTEGLYDYSILHTFTERNGVIQSIEINGNSQWGIPSQFFAQDWDHYSLDQVLTRYGVPSRARIFLYEYGGGGDPFYALLVFYDDLGIGIRYHGQAFWTDDLLRTCFLFTDITLWLQSPESLTPLHENVDPDEWSYVVPLEEATGMSMEEFYNIFRQPGAYLEAPPTFQ